MIDAKLLTKIRQLDFEDRAELARALNAEVAAESVPLTKAQMAELQRRLDKYGDSTEGIPWEEVERKLIARERNGTASDQNAPRSRKRTRRGTPVVRKSARKAQL